MAGGLAIVLQHCGLGVPHPCIHLYPSSLPTVKLRVWKLMVLGDKRVP